MVGHKKIAHVAGFIGVVLTTVSFMPQLATTYETKTIRGLSCNFLWLSLFTAIAWAVYAYELCAYYQLVANIILIIMVIALLLMYYKYQHHR